MATPTYVTEGASDASGVGDVSIPWPVGAHQVDDIGILVVQSNGAATLPGDSDISGWAGVPGSYVTTGDITDGVSAKLFWRRAASGAEPDAILPLGGNNHIAGRISVIRGAWTGGNPIHRVSVGANATPATTFTLPGFTTTLIECRVVVIQLRGNDATGQFFSGQANADLSPTLEEYDGGFTAGDGGGTAAWQGAKDTAGTVGNTTGNIAASVPFAGIVYAITSQATGAAEGSPAARRGGLAKTKGLGQDGVSIFRKRNGIPIPAWSI